MDGDSVFQDLGQDEIAATGIAHVLRTSHQDVDWYVVRDGAIDFGGTTGRTTVSLGYDEEVDIALGSGRA